MERAEYTFVVAAEDQASAGRAAQALADTLHAVEGVIGADRRKGAGDTMDLGVIVTAIATSGATLALAQGVAAWLRARKGASITIERTDGAESVKAAVAGIDAQAAIRIAEIIRG